MTEQSDPRLAAFVAKLREFVQQRDWDQFHDPKNLAMAIASEAGELLAELRWISNSDADSVIRGADLRQRVENEVGDIAIALLLFCERTGIDLLAAAEHKLEINAANYPATVSKGRSDRPTLPSSDQGFSRVIAVDWSGEAGGGRDTIWIAEVVDGVLETLEKGRSRSEVVDRLIQIASTDPNIVVGLDFAFAFPSWFVRELGATDARQLWRMVADQGESWLRECRAPFWGRPGITKPNLAEHFRRTDIETGRRSGGQAKSVFQIGGAGAVGTGSIRGMPELLRLHQAGFSIWPFDPPARPLVVEIYPRLLTGPVVKSDPHARAQYVSKLSMRIPVGLRDRAASTEDAFDAAVSAVIMAQHSSELATLPAANNAEAMEGAIWAPRFTAS